MIQLVSPETSLETATTTMEDNLKSHVSPWLAPLLYRLGHHLVFPTYFRRLEISGQENLPTTGPVILAPTHRARWDALLVPYATGRLVTGRDLRFMVRIDQVQGIEGWFIRRMGGFSIDPKHPAIGTLRHGVELLKQGEMLVIFPEGDIFRDGLLHPLKPGLARLAIGAESSQPGLSVKVVPISIHYSQPLPQWGGDVNIRIGSPLLVADYNTGSVKEKAQQLTSDLEAALKQLSGEQPAVKCQPSALKMPF